MCLPIAEADRFYRIWRPLLRFANEELRVTPNLSGKGTNDNIDVKLAIKVRDALWKHESVLEKFVALNPAQLSSDELAIAESWKYHRKGQFIIFKALKKHAIFISQDNRAEVFAVKGLYSTFEEVLGPYIPALVETVLLPFGNEIVSDGLLQSYNLLFGSGIRKEFKEIFDDAKERGTIITTLLPNQSHPSRESLTLQAESTNTKVLDAFIKYQYQSGRSPKTVERDLQTARNFSHFLLIEQSKPASLRDFQQETLLNFLVSVPQKERKAVILSLKRFLQFLRETNRLIWNEAENLLDIIKQI